MLALLLWINWIRSLPERWQHLKMIYRGAQMGNLYMKRMRPDLKPELKSIIQVKLRLLKLVIRAILE